MTKIEWCDITLNPIVGCSKCSPGCEHCYAEKFAARLAKNPNSKIAAKYSGVIDKQGKWTGKLSEEGWDCMDAIIRSPAKKVFLGSMTDIFHENMCQESFNELIDNLTYVYKQHTFFLLTKRPAHALDMVLAYENGSAWAKDGLPGHESHRLPKNVWLGVTVCTQQEVNEKLPILMKVPASKRFVSVEPMLESVNILDYLPGNCDCDACVYGHGHYPFLDWVICGAETGPNARPMSLEWARNLRDQCKDTGTPFFFKKAGNKTPVPDDLMIRQIPEQK